MYCRLDLSGQKNEGMAFFSFSQPVYWAVPGAECLVRWLPSVRFSEDPSGGGGVNSFQLALEATGYFWLIPLGENE